MSQELFNLRRNLAQVPSLVKQSKFLPAVQNTLASVSAVTTQNLMRSEQDELHDLLTKACRSLDQSQELRTYFPLSITYDRNNPGATIDILQELASILETEAIKDVNALSAVIEKKRTALEKGQKELDEGEHDAARETFSTLTDEFSDDAELASEVGESFLQRGLYEDASHYLEKSASIHAGSAHVFNRLAISLRKLKRFDAAEKNFLRAIEIEPEDPNLYFNIGRLFLDWGKWAEVVHFAEKATTLNPSFKEAAQLASYAKKQQEAQ